MSCHRFLITTVTIFIWSGIIRTGAARGDSGATGLRFANIFSDHMVLQQEKPLRVWGWARSGAAVEVTITDDDTSAARQEETTGGERDAARRVSMRYVEETSAPFSPVTAHATAAPDGLWVATFAPLEATFRPKLVIATSGEERVLLRDVLIGEVWVASGQSNMAWGLQGDTEWSLERESADFPGIRCARLRAWQPQPQDDLEHRVSWAALSQDYRELRRISGVAYYFAVRLHRYLKVPVGIVQNAVGGTLAETWTSRRTLETLPELSGFLAHFDATVAGWPEEKERRLAAYEAAARKAAAEGKDPPRRPRLGGPLESSNQPGGCHNAMVRPIGRMALRGALFFQGENNSIGKWTIYRATFPKMIEDWRATFGAPELPFGVISLFGFGAPARDREPEAEMIPPGLFWYAAIRDVHFRTFRAVPHTGLIVTFDVGDADNIHPHRKRVVGQRAARWALAKVYGKPIAHTGPVYRELEVDGARLKLRFDLDPEADPAGPWYESCPITRAGAYRGFVIAGEDRHFYPANVRRRDEERLLEVWSEHVPQPVAVRYSWSGYPDGNVIGLDHLPAPPFRTDDWPLVGDTPEREDERRAWESRLRTLRQSAAAQSWRRKLEEAASLLSDAEREAARHIAESARATWSQRLAEARAALAELALELEKN